jgi:hypothetical protein
MGREATHRTCESYRRLDVRELARGGLLTGSSTITWSRSGRVTGTISVCGDGESITLAYVADGEEIEERVRLSQTRVHFGGTRSWFLCPGCDRRVGVLYGGSRFRCRHCHNLRYASQREPQSFRAIAKIQRVQLKLGGSADLSQPTPIRPRYMHHRTYQRLLREEAAALQAYTCS